MPESDPEFGLWSAIEAMYFTVAPRLAERMLREQRLTLTEYRAMRCLQAHPEPHMRVQELANALGISHSAGSRLASKLQGVGLLKTHACETDRRGRYVELAEGGRQRLEEVRGWYVNEVEDLLGTDAGVKAIVALRRALADR